MPLPMPDGQMLPDFGGRVQISPERNPLYCWISVDDRRCGQTVADDSLAEIGSAPAQTVDDVNWINKCIADNKDEGQTRPVLVSYCTCMNNQMSSNERLSITAWEKTHKKEADACGAKAGWKG